MPRPPLNHERCRSSLCLLCFGKTKTMRPISFQIQSVIEEHFLTGYNPDDDRLPLVLCMTCRVVVGEYDKGIFKRSIKLFDYTKLRQLPVTTRSNKECTCLLCQTATQGGWTESTVGRPLQAAIVEQTPTVKNRTVHICATCFSEKGRGKPHHCIDSTKLQNLKEMLSTDEKTSEKLAASVLREKSGGSGGSSRVVSLQTGGRPMNVVVSPPNTLASNKQVLSARQLANIQVEMNLSSNATLKMTSLIRNATKSRKSIEPNTKAKLTDINHSLDDFFDVTVVEFVKVDSKNISTPINKVVAYCKDLDGLVANIINKRNYGCEDNLLFKIGIDGGGGFFKLCLTVSSQANHNDCVPLKKHLYEMNTVTTRRKDSGVKRIFLLAIVPDIQENYRNVLRLWILIQLVGQHAATSLSNKFIATDLKLANILLGLMAHGSCYPCTWCDSHKDSLHERGNMRTLGSITDMFWRWHEAGGDKHKAKYHGNVIHLSILKGDPDNRVIDILPVPELHLLLGSVNTLFKALEKVWPDAMDWPRYCYVEREAYHGGSFNGNSCHILLSKLDRLRSMVPLVALKFVGCFLALKNVVHSCFGQHLHSDYQDHINMFREKYMELGISITPKIHAIMYHIVDFCEEHQTGLGQYSEQAVEAVHSDFKPTWSKYKVSECNPSYSAMLLKATRDYNSKHL